MHNRLRCTAALLGVFFFLVACSDSEAPQSEQAQTSAEKQVTEAAETVTEVAEETQTEMEQKAETAAESAQEMMAEAETMTEKAMTEAEQATQTAMADAEAMKEEATAKVENTTEEVVAKAEEVKEQVVSEASATVADITDPDKPYQLVDGQISENVMEGWRTYNGGGCGACHGKGGVGAVGPNLAVSVSEKLTKEEFKNIVTNGVSGTMMRPHKTNTRVMDNLDNLYAYLLARGDGVLGPGNLIKSPLGK